MAVPANPSPRRPDAEQVAPIDPSLSPLAEDDLLVVTQLLGRQPKTAFDVVVRRRDGVPVVTRNAPFEHDGTPMPTRYWLLPSARANDAIGRLEASGGVRAVEVDVDAAAIAAAHDSYASERSASIPDEWSGPRPSGGVGGTRQGTKCLHAHYAYFLAGGPDPVGQWVWERLAEHQRDQPHPPRCEQPPTTDIDGGVSEGESATP